MNSAPVLINVDDVEAERSARNAVLTNAGFLVHDGTGTQQALELVDTHRPDLVVIHLRDGHDSEDWRRLKLKDREVAVLQIGAPAVPSGADAVLPESVDATVLVHTVREMLRVREQERALAEANARLEAAQQELHRSNEEHQQ